MSKEAIDFTDQEFEVLKLLLAKIGGAINKHAPQDEVDSIHRELHAILFDRRLVAIVSAMCLSLINALELVSQEKVALQ